MMATLHLIQDSSKVSRQISPLNLVPTVILTVIAIAWLLHTHTQVMHTSNLTHCNQHYQISMHLKCKIQDCNIMIGLCNQSMIWCQWFGSLFWHTLTHSSLHDNYIIWRTLNHQDLLWCMLKQHSVKERVIHSYSSTHMMMQRNDAKWLWIWWKLCSLITSYSLIHDISFHI